MLDTFLLTLGACLLLWRAIPVIQVGRDAHRRGFAPREIMRWAAIAAVAEDRYWWGARLDQFAAPEARELLVEMARAHHLLNVTNVRCPLCDTEIQNALGLTSTGELVVRRQSRCGHCDFRLDACRHCAHFLPAADDTTAFDRQGDFSHGRCGFYRSSESVRTAFPQHAPRLESMGYEALPAPRRIVDSYIPLPECTAFLLKPEYARQSHVPWLNRQRIALIRLHQKINRPR